MHCLTVVAIALSSLILCGADVSHLSNSYLPPGLGVFGNGYSGGYSSYPSYSSGGGYYSGSSYASPLISSSYKNYAVPQYSTYTSPSRTYLPANTGYAGYNGYSGLDTKYASNGGYIY